MNDRLDNVTLAVLAGGAGRRMGKPKALLTIGGKAILEHLLEQLNWPGPTLLVTAPGREHPPGWQKFDAEATDPVSDQGPLRGIVTALEAAKSAEVVLTPIDMPAIRLVALQTLVAQLRDHPDAVAIMLERMVQHVPQLEPMPCAFRSRTGADLVRRQLDSGNLALHALAKTPDVHLMRCPDDWPADFWINLNCPADLSRIQSALL